MEITNKKELLAALSPWIPNQFGQNGEPRSPGIFDAIESDRAMALNKEIIDNLREEFNKHAPFELTPQEFIRIAARNIDLNTQEERLHFMWQTGIMWETIMNRIEKLKSQEPPPNSFIGDN